MSSLHHIITRPSRFFPCTLTNMGRPGYEAIKTSKELSVETSQEVVALPEVLKPAQLACVEKVSSFDS